jgi:hypothetical protein
MTGERCNRIAVPIPGVDLAENRPCYFFSLLGAWCSQEMTAIFPLDTSAAHQGRGHNSSLVGNQDIEVDVLGQGLGHLSKSP